MVDVGYQEEISSIVDINVFVFINAINHYLF